MVTGSSSNYADQIERTFMSHKQKGLIEAFKTVLSRVDHRFCVRHLHENFKRVGFRAQTFKDVLWATAASTTTQWFKEAMETIKALDESAFLWLEDEDPGQWSRAYFNTTMKCDVLLNITCEVFNSFILDVRDKSILTLIAMVKDLIMVRMQMNRDKAEQWEGKICPKPKAKLLKCVKDASSCMPMKSIGITSKFIQDLVKTNVQLIWRIEFALVGNGSRRAFHANMRVLL
ncbi:hypothetical protein LIER_37356 [Lithospermum erythrorhizon]|uniref:Transposase n=1 Tax=Lithospermum erythrorhizon TaxID=34254 RepID=A0AAV3PKI0_LITER